MQFGDAGTAVAAWPGPQRADARCPAPRAACGAKGKSAYRRALAAGNATPDLDRGTWYVSTVKVVWGAEHLLGRVVVNGAAILDACLDVVGDHREVEEVETVSDPGTQEALAETEAAIRETSVALAGDDADLTALLSRLSLLKERRTALRSIPSSITREIAPTGRTLREAWDATDDVEAPRALLKEGIDHVRVSSRITRGATLDPARLEILWQS